MLKLIRYIWLLGVLLSVHILLKIRKGGGPRMEKISGILSNSNFASCHFGRSYQLYKEKITAYLTIKLNEKHQRIL